MAKRFFQFGVRQFAFLVGVLGVLFALLTPRLHDAIHGLRVANTQQKLANAFRDLETALRTNDVALARSALDRGASLDQPVSPVERAIKNGQAQMLDLLLQRGADKQRIYRFDGLPMNGPALSMAVAVKLPFATRREMVEVLIKHGVAVHDESYGWTAIDIAIEQNDAAMGEFLRQCGAPYGPRAMAAFNRVDELKQVLARTPETLHERFKPTYATLPGQGPTLLGTALSHGHREMSQFLIEQGAPLDTREGLGMTLLHLAARGGDPELVRLLVSRGIDVNARDRYEDTALTDSIWVAKLEIVKALLEAGVNVNARSSRRDLPTALHIAVHKKDLELVRVLFAAGADVTIVNGEGKTALDLADQAPPEIQELLRAAKPKPCK